MHLTLGDVDSAYTSATGGGRHWSGIERVLRLVDREAFDGRRVGIAQGAGALQRLLRGQDLQAPVLLATGVPMIDDTTPMSDFRWRPLPNLYPTR